MTSPLDDQIASTEAQLAALQARKAAEDALRAAASVHQRQLAIDMHEAGCDKSHTPTASGLACTWFLDPNANNPETALWSENPAHVFWLGVVALSIQKATTRGWTVTEPAGA
jgi:hypothetical protein